MVNLSKIKALTNSGVSDADLPALAPGEEYERVITPQKFIILLQIATLNVDLVRLQIGVVEVPFELLPNMDGRTKTYRPTGLDSDDLKRRLVGAGATVATSHSIAMAPGLDVRTVVKNAGPMASVKFRVAVVVQEEADE